MDIKAALLSEHSRKQTDKIVKVCAGNPKKFGELMQCFLSKEYVLAQRAAWPVGLCAEKKPAFMKPYWTKLLKNLDNTGLHDAVKRASVRVMQFCDIDTKYHASIINRCFAFLLNKNEAIAVRVFSLAVLERMLKYYPELANELIVIVESEFEENPKPAFISRGKKVLKTISRIKKL